MTLFARDDVVGTFLGFSEGGLEFHADILLPYRNDFQRTPMHGQFVLVALEHDSEGVLGRVTNISAQGRLAGGAGEDYAIRAIQDDRPIPEDLRSQYLRYRIDIRILGVLREQGGDKPPQFVSSHRRLPHVGAKVAFLGPELLRQVAAHYLGDGEGGTAELGFLAMGEFVYSADDPRAGDTDWVQIQEPMVVPKFHIDQLVSRRSFVFARAGFGKSNLVKLLFAKLYGTGAGPSVTKRHGQRVPVGTIIFDPDGEYFWPDDKGRPGLCDVPELQDKIVVYTDREGPSAFYQSFVVDKVRLDIRELEPSKVISLVISADRQDQQNIAKLKGLRPDAWQKLVNAVWRDRGSTDLAVFYETLQLKVDGSQDAEALAARANMVRVVQALHDPTSQLLRTLKLALKRGCLCVVDISRMRGSQGLSFAGLILQHIFEHNQDEFTKATPTTIPTIAVIEEAQSVLGGRLSKDEGPFVEWVKEGRKYDLGSVMITQQPGSLPRELLSQGDNWFVFHLLSADDLRALKMANAHFSDDLLSSLLNEPIVGHGVFWSSSGATPYPIPVRTLSFERTYEMADRTYNRSPVDGAAMQIRNDQARINEEAIAQVRLTLGDDEVPMVDDEQVDKGALLSAQARAALRNTSRFWQMLCSDGIEWWRVQRILADAIDASAVAEDPFEWAYAQVAPALNAVIGHGLWDTVRRSDPKDPTKQRAWVIATDKSVLPCPEQEELPGVPERDPYDEPF